ncbi:hypothetical protein Prudu_005882 [Prunus dulcis]|uniref:Uncharacterized protein n=1 Tax=Prunus dulcis TaxID=3755 RepID=A0A4Y1QYH7_PRUDU|nr:hypothetical protein Prudu_005882 [Prunus dulcis]
MGGAAESGSKQQQQQPNRVDMDRKRKRKIVTTLVAVELDKQHLCASMMSIIMAKPAGGPSERDQHAGMDED